MFSSASPKSLRFTDEFCVAAQFAGDVILLHFAVHLVQRAVRICFGSQSDSVWHVADA